MTCSSSRLERTATIVASVFVLLNLFYSNTLVSNLPSSNEAIIKFFLPTRSRAYVPSMQAVMEARTNHDYSKFLQVHNYSSSRFNATRFDKNSLGNYTLHTCFDGNRNVTIPQVPSFIIIGAQKSGTSSLFTYLLQHPNVVPTLNFLTKNTTEMHFFDWHYVRRSGEHMQAFWREHNISTEEEFGCLMRQRYAAMFPQEYILEASSKGIPVMAFEKTPVYLFLPYVAPLIRRTCPWLHKLVVILRNPVDRAYSNHWFSAVALYERTGRVMDSFESQINKELEYMRSVGLTRVPNMTTTINVDRELFVPNCTRQHEDDWFRHNTEETAHDYKKLLRGLYAMQLRHWLRYFPKNETLVLNHDDLERDSRGVYQRILDHVGLPNHYLQYLERRLHHSTWYRPMRNETRRFLTKFFEPYNLQLVELLGEEWRGVWRT